MAPRFNRLLLEHTVGKWSRPGTWFSVLIRVLICSRYSHVSIDFYNEAGERRILEAVWPKVHEVPYEEWEGHAHRKVLPKEVDETYHEVDLQAARALVGKRYGVRDLLQVLLHIFRTYWFSFGNKWNGKDGGGERGVFCSELGAVLLGLKDSHLILPRDFERMGGLTSGEEFETFRSKPERKEFPALAKAA